MSTKIKAPSICYPTCRVPDPHQRQTQLHNLTRSVTQRFTRFTSWMRSWSRAASRWRRCSMVQSTIAGGVAYRFDQSGRHTWLLL